MSKKNKSDEWFREFDAFLRVEGIAPPRMVSDHIRQAVRSELEPSLKRVCAKLFALHMVAIGLVTLVCPQLGVGPLIGGHGLMHFFMAFGRLPCAALCGALLFGTSALLASFCLRREELRVANQYRFLNITLLASVSFAGLMVMGGEADRAAYLSWIFGAVVTGWLTMRFGSLVRFQSETLLRPR